MGEPKLVLPWRGRTVIECLIDAWLAGGVSKVIVVAREDDHQLAQLVRGTPALLVTPSLPPPEMKDSIRIGLDFVQQQFRPCGEDVWLLAPADMPELPPAVVRKLLMSHHPAKPQILVPTCGGVRGHPVLFPWRLAQAVGGLGAEVGVNDLLRQHPWTAIPTDEEGVHQDLDTPEDYRRRSPAS